MLFALVLGLTALAASIAPAPRVGETETTPAPPAAPPAPSTDEPGEVQVKFRAPRARGKPPARKVVPGRPLVVEVASKAPGQVRIPRLGRIASVTETVPARFSVLAPAAGRYDVLFEPTGGEIERVGSIVSAR
jgi:hypothetical protein